MILASQLLTKIGLILLTVLLLIFLSTYLLVKKDINSWYFWIVGDIAYCTLSFATDDYKYIIMYGTLLICAIYGCIKNNKLYDKKRNETIIRTF